MISARTHALLRTWLKLGLFYTALALTGVNCWAELPPYVYQEWQQKAPESLVLQVQSVTTVEADEPGRTQVRVTAVGQVKEVTRSQSGVKPGQMITISYVHYRYVRPLVGPGEVPILKRGEVYPAFLKKGEKGQTYAPAAGRYSFELVR